MLLIIINFEKNINTFAILIKLLNNNKIIIITNNIKLIYKII